MTIQIPPHADIRVVCDDLYRLEKAAESVGLAAPILTKTRELLHHASFRTGIAESRVRKLREALMDFIRVQDATKESPPLSIEMRQVVDQARRVLEEVKE